jgi:hypothetical protein
MSPEVFALLAASISLILTILGWTVIYRSQTKLLERQAKTEQEIKKLDLAHQLVLSNRQATFDVLPTAREKMLETHGWIAYLHRPVMEYPDFSTWSEPQINDWVRSLEFTPFQKASLLMADDKEKYYLETQFEYDIQQAQNSLNDFHNFLLFKKPFIDPQLLAEFSAIESLFEQALAGIAFARHNYDKAAEQDIVTEFTLQAPQLMDKVEDMIKEQMNKKIPGT